MMSSGQGVIPDRRYSPRALLANAIICRIGVIPIPTVKVWMEEDLLNISGLIQRLIEDNP
jgi:hypothetical protein